jgi:hypothetical protein
MTDDEKALGWTAELGRLRQGNENTLEGWTDMQIVKAALYEYAGTAGESFSIEALLRIEAELERLRKEHA